MNTKITIENLNTDIIHGHADQETDIQSNLYTIKDGTLSSAEWLASPNFNQRPTKQQRSTVTTKKPKNHVDNKLVNNIVDINTIVIHNISLPPNQFNKTDKNGRHYVHSLFTNTLDWDEHPYFDTIRGIEVSAHLFIERNGDITQFVNFDDRAWHAGLSNYLGRDAVNDFSIGIELEGSDFQNFTTAQYTALAGSIVALYSTYPQTRRHLVGHSDIAPVRKTDPGEYFDWYRLRKMVSERLNK